MAARRSKSQARRNAGGGSGLPGWAWLVIGVLLTLLLLAGLMLGGVVSAPKALGGGDGFFRPQPNPDAQPAPVDGDAEAVVSEDLSDREAVPARPRVADPGEAPAEDTDYDFYTLLPGRETPMTEAEVAATAQAETRRAQAQARAEQARRGEGAPTPAGTGAAATLPAPVDDTATPRIATAPASPETTGAPTAPVPTPAPVRTTPATAATASPPAPVGDGSRYVLQAGAFQASGQAEELKAKIALLGLGARVESTQIGGKTVYRVRMGPYGTASDLAEAKSKLSSGGLQGMAVKVD